MLTRTWRIDMSSWYKPKLRISKRLLSTRVIIRNFGNIFESGAVLLTSNLYLFAIIGCAAHHRRPLARSILYLLVTRYFSIFLELYWVARLVIQWDRERTSRWSTRLYAETRTSMWYSIGKDLLHPFFLTKTIPLLIGSISISLYYTYCWTWAKWFGIVAFTEIATRLVFTCVGMSAVYPLVNCGRYSLTRPDLSDMPEDMTNYSRTWRETNEKARKGRLERRKRLLKMFRSGNKERGSEREVSALP